MDARDALHRSPAPIPAMAAQLMLEHKGIPYKRTDLLPGDLEGRRCAAAGFPGNTVPAMKIDGEKVQGSREIARELDRLQPEPPLFPADPEQRAAVEEAERFGDEELQHPVRQILWWALRKDKAPAAQLLRGRQAGHPDRPLAVKTAAPIVALSARFNEATDENVRADLAALPAACSTGSTSWIAAGTLDGEQLNAADFQIAPSCGLAMTLQDLRPLIEARPAGELAARVVPDYPGDVPPILPAEWLEPLRASAAGLGLQRRADGALDPFARAEGRERVGEPRAVGQRQLGVELEQRHEDEAAAGDLAVRQGEALGRELEVAEQQQVDVERPRAVAGGVERAAALGLDLLAERRAAPRAPARCGCGPRR